MLVEISRQILRDMQNHKIRSFLAIIGILWGTLTVVLLMSLSMSFAKAGQTQMASLSNGAWRLWPNVTTRSFAGLPPGQAIYFHAQDILNIPNNVPSIQIASPVLQKSNAVVWKQNQSNTLISGVTSDYFDLNNLVLSPASRFFNTLDFTKTRQVTILGNKLAQTLFHHNNPLGQYVSISGMQFLVVGVQRSDTSKGAFNWDANSLLIPLTTFQGLWGDKPVVNFILLPNEGFTKTQIHQQLFEYLAAIAHFDPKDSSAINIFDTSAASGFFTWFFRAIELFFSFCGLLTLSVGAIGVANMMFLIIQERTAEFGLRMAIGATPRAILFQVLLESSIIVAIGGALGLLLSLITVMILHHLPLPTWLGVPVISGSVVCITLIILSSVSLLAGYFPAKRAADLVPVDALRGSV